MKREAAAQETKHQSPADAIAEQKRRTFTSDKLDLINVLNADARLGAAGFKVIVCILQHVNDDKGCAWPSVETISIKTRLPIRTVERALTRSRKIGWLGSRRVFDRKTRTTHNIYWVLTDNMNAIADQQLELLEAQKARRAVERDVAKNVAQSATSGGTVKGQSATSGGRQSATSGGVTPKREHLTRKIASKQKVLVVDRGEPAFDISGGDDDIDLPDIDDIDLPEHDAEFDDVAPTRTQGSRPRAFEPDDDHWQAMVAWQCGRAALVPDDLDDEPPGLPERRDAGGDAAVDWAVRMAGRLSTRPPPCRWHRGTRGAR